MSPLDETLADYRGTGLTTGPQIMAHLRPALAARGVLRAINLRTAHDGTWVRTAGLVIVRQRPGTAKGFLFLTLEDETGMANAVVTPDMFQRHRALLHSSPLLLVEGPLQKVDGVIHVRARRFMPLSTRETTTIRLTALKERQNLDYSERQNVEQPECQDVGHSERQDIDQPGGALPRSHDFH